MQQQRNVVLVGPIAPFKGGISAFNTSLAHELARAGHQVHAIAWLNGTARVPRSEQIDVSMPVQSNVQYLLKWYSPWSWVRAAVHSVSCKPDLLVAHWTLPEVAPIYAVINLIVKRCSPNTRIAYIIHNATPHEPRIGDRFMQKLGFRNVSYFMVHANAEKIKLAKDISCDQIHTGFHPVYDRYLDLRSSMKERLVDPQLTTWLNENTDRPVLLFFGFVKPYKGLDQLLQAMTMFEEALLIVAGQVFSVCKSLRDQVDALGLSKRVFWLDHYIAEDEVPKIFALADIVALPYRSGTQSGVASLAFAFNVPVVATDVGGLSESVDCGSTGYIVPPGNPCAFAKALQRAYNDRSRLRNNISNIKETKSWSRYCEILLSWLELDDVSKIQKNNQII